MTKLDEIANTEEITPAVIVLLKAYDEKLSETVCNLNKSWKLLIAAHESSVELDRLANGISRKKYCFKMFTPKPQLF